MRLLSMTVVSGAVVSGPGEYVLGSVDGSGDGTEDVAGNSSSGEMVRLLMFVAAAGGC